MHLPLVGPYLRLIKTNKAFRWLWFSQVISQLGDWFNLIASASLVANLSGSGLAIGGLFVARLLPPFLLGPVVGVVADRFDRRKILIISDLLRTGVVLNFLFVRDGSDIWLLYSLTILQLSIGAFFEPTRAAVLPGLVAREELITANTLASLTWSTMLALGAAAGGLVTAWLGTTSAFLIDAATYLLSAWFLTRIDFSMVAAEPDLPLMRGAGWGAFVEGVSYLWQRPAILVLALLKASSALAFGGVEIVQVAYAEEIFPLGGDGSGTLGLIYFVVGLGTGLAPVLARQWTGDDPPAMHWAILGAYLTMVAGYSLLGWGSSLLLVLVGTFIRTTGTGINWVYSSSLLQIMVPSRFLGRVFAFDLAMMTLASTTSTLWAGWAKDELALNPGQISLVLAGSCLVMMVSWVAFMVLHGPAEEMASTS